MGNPDTDSSSCSMERNTMLKDVKVVVVGQAKCGKTALVQRFVNNIFSNTYTPTGFEKYAKKCKVGEFTVQFSIWDTSGSGSYDSVRPLAYPDANVFLLCFNIGDQDSLDLAINKWYPEIRSHCTTTPVILCGCQGDVRNMDNIDKISLNLSEKKTQFPQIITNEQIVMALYHITAAAYVETSSLYEDEIITCNNNKNNSFNSSIHYNNSNNNSNNNNNSMSSTMTTTGVLEAFEIAAEAALGLLNKKNLTKKKKNDDCQNPILIKTNKKQLKNKLKGRSKNCCVM